MTLPDERYRAMVRIRDELLSLAHTAGPIRKHEFRRMVYNLLRHYPTTVDLQDMAKACPRLLWTIRKR